MSKPPVTIPQTKLGAQLAEAAAIKHEMAKLLQELESKVAGRPIQKTGHWRHHPTDWPK